MRFNENHWYRDDSILHNGLSASYDHAHDLLRDLGGHIHALRAQTLSLLQFHEFLDSRRHERCHFSAIPSSHRLSAVVTPRLLSANTDRSHGGIYITAEQTARTNERIRMSGDQRTDYRRLSSTGTKSRTILRYRETIKRNRAISPLRFCIDRQVDFQARAVRCRARVRLTPLVIFVFSVFEKSLALKNE